MRLNQLDIKGFKSFADKTNIRFDDNITGIVGPNGCGKSNVVDAIRWVLGEQKTSSLRLEKMENVIFNGTKKRKPSGLAEVTLTFDNTRNTLPTEFTSVTVSRTLYRDGDSGYKLNGVPCRLKDITNLFLDTGIGSDSYAIIELKMIDEILNDRDNSRRKLFEQAAGISKYKQRKKETLLKLNATDADLNRVEDLLFEIEGNLKTLEKQAKKAVRYQKLKEEYKTTSLNLTMVQLQDIKNSYKLLEQQQEEERVKLTGTDKKIAELNSKIEAEKARLLDQEKHLSQAQKQVNEINQKISKLENERNMKRQEQQFLNEKKEQLSRQIAESGPRKAQIAKELESLEALLKENNETVSELKNKLTEQQQQKQSLETEKVDSDNALQKLLNQKSELEKQIFQHEKELAVIESRYQTLEINFKEAGEEEKIKAASLSKLDEEFNQTTAILEEKKKAVEKAEQDMIAFNEKLNAFAAEKEALKDKLTKVERKADAKKNEYTLVKSLVDNMEGFPESIRYLRKQTDRMKNIPLLSDIIYTEDNYRTAIESYLEPYLNYFVVPDWETAAQAVDLLKGSAKGRANFFILSAFEKKYPKAAKIEGLEAVKDLIDTDENFRPVVDALFHHVYITTKSDEQVPESLNDDIVVLDKGGSWVRGSKQLSGGSVGLFEGKRIGRAKSLEKLKKEIEKLDKESWEIKGSLDKLKNEEQRFQQENPEVNVKTATDALRQTEQSRKLIEERILQTKKTISESQQKNTGITEEIHKLESQRGEHFETLKKLKAELKEVTDKYQSLLEENQNKQADLQSKRDIFNETQLLYHQKLNRSESLEKDIQNKKEQSEDLNKNEIHADRELKTATAKLKEIASRLSEIETQLQTSYTEKEQQELNLTEDENRFFKAKGDVQKQEKLLSVERDAHRSGEQLIQRINDKITEIKIQLSGLKERLQAEFKTDINDLINAEPEADWNETDLSEKVEQLKKRIENFGEVNPMALEAFNEMKSRYDFISEQRKDLLDAKTSLTNTIQEIEDTAKEKLLDAFYKVRENFIMVFRGLFTEEDNCNLTLSDPENPLESSIQIFAQPKGKRPQVVDQLSGGEKALTALSLLFSLYLLKPAPFCILDEVDAPLDDANIEKFNKTIREFSKQSQFIIVTHNKITMSSVDVIYGVTMAEQGVSKVVPVNFGDLKAAS